MIIKIYNADCRRKIQDLEEKQFDLVILDPFFDDANDMVDDK